jgi:hypothetical protein
MRKCEIESIQLQDINESLIEQHELDVPVWIEPVYYSEPVEGEEAILIEPTEEQTVERNLAFDKYLEDMQLFNSNLQFVFEMYIKTLENDRVEAIKSRWLQLTDQTYILHSQGDLRPNHYDKLQEIIENDDIEFLEQFEIAHSEHLAYLEQQKINQTQLHFLASTDWKVIRHRDQVDSNIETSLTEQEYLDLLTLRQEARGKVI